MSSTDLFSTALPVVLKAALQAILPRERVIVDPLRRLAYGIDAGFHWMRAAAISAVEDKVEPGQLMAACRALMAPLTFARPATTTAC
jgi:D-lactate dehydrogenase